MRKRQETNQNLCVICDMLRPRETVFEVRISDMESHVIACCRQNTGKPGYFTVKPNTVYQISVHPEEPLNPRGLYRWLCIPYGEYSTAYFYFDDYKWLPIDKELTFVLHDANYNIPIQEGEVVLCPTIPRGT